MQSSVPPHHAQKGHFSPPSDDYVNLWHSDDMTVVITAHAQVINMPLVRMRMHSDPQWYMHCHVTIIM